jgi:hypothetical protein
MMIGKEGHPGSFVFVDVKDYQGLKDVEDRISDVLLCLDSTSDTLETFSETYEQLRLGSMDNNSEEESSYARSAASDAIVFTLREKQKEIAFSRQKAEALLAKTQNTRALVGPPEGSCPITADWVTTLDHVSPRAPNRS